MKNEIKAVITKIEFKNRPRGMCEVFVTTLDVGNESIGDFPILTVALILQTRENNSASICGHSGVPVTLEVDGLGMIARIK